jgi:uncharacterized RDD family membrane protein YckC
MPWYYAEDGAQRGPVSEEEFADLVRLAKVRADTLVWREGMANWQPYASVTGAATPAIPPVFSPPPASASVGPNEVVCHECGTIVPKENAIQYGSIWVCANCKPMFVQKLREGARVPVIVPTGQFEYAGFWIRFGAKLIDGLILGVVVGVPLVVFAFMPLLGSANTNPRSEILFQLILNLGYFTANIAFNTFFIGKFGATPGKMACNLRVIMSDGSKASYLRGFGRSLAEILSGMLCYIGYIIAGFDDQKRALHDHMCDTRVVRK